MKILLDRIKDSPRPIRTSWDEDALNELAKSIAEQGVIVPIKVRPANDAARGLCEMQAMRPVTRESLALATEAQAAQGRAEYEIVYGHRRVEAARRANLTEIEAIVEGVDDTAALVQALIENVQREDMQPVDLAKALRALLDATGWSQRELERRGVMEQSRTSVILALLDVPEEVQRLVTRAPSGDVVAGKVTEAHVREVRRVASGDDRVITETIRKAADEGLNVKQTRAVAETVARTTNPERRKALLETPYNQFVHNPEYAEANEQMARAAAPSPGEEFDRLPAIAVGLEAMKEFRKTMTLMLEACEVGKASPEARRFFARRIDGMIQFLTSIKEGLAE